MDKTLNLLEFDKVLDFLASYAITSVGKSKCKTAKIYNDVEKIQYELNLTSEARYLLNKFIEPKLNLVCDVRDIINKAKKANTLEPEEIISVLNIYISSRLMLNFLEKNETNVPLLSSFSDKLFVDNDFENEITDTFNADLSIKDSASSVLKSLRNSYRDTETNLKNSIASLLSNNSFVNNLQDTIWTTRDGRVVFQVKAECKNKVHGIVHDTSASGQTFFIEPKELVEIDNKLRELELSINAEIERILAEITHEISANADDILNNLDVLSEIDFIFARARYSLKYDFASPVLSQDKKIFIKGVKNPVLMSVCDNVVENDFYLDDERSCLVITGSNTGGKTVLIKTIGLIVLMMKAGMHIPAFEAEIYPFSKVFADIGDEQSIIQSLSTFSSHIKNIINIINSSDENSLIILDEIASGTDPQEGASLAQALLEYMASKSIFVLCTTHYGELKSLAYTKDKFKNASVEFNTDTLSPTYKLLMDIPGASNAINIAKNLGLNEQIIQYAQDIHYKQKDLTAEILQELQNTQQNLSRSANEARRLEKSAGKLKEEYSEKLDEIKKQKRKNIDTYKKKYESKINNARKEIKEIMDEFRKNTSEKLARRAYARLAQMENEAREQFNTDLDDVSQRYRSLDWANVRIGDKAILRGLNQQVVILSLPDKNKNVQIQMGQIKTKVKQTKLAEFDDKLISKQIKTSSYVPVTKKFSLDRYELSQTLDLRGYRVDEALDEIESYFDKARLANLTPVYIIHGHGTGALKSVIRDYISTSPYVCKYRVGEPAEGGDGVTVVDIN